MFFLGYEEPRVIGDYPLGNKQFAIENCHRNS